MKSEKKQTFLLNIKWHLERPTFIPPRSFVDLSFLPNAENTIQEEELCLPPHTLAFIEHAFSQEWTRDQGWLVNKTYNEAAQKAASLYKRGVYYGSKEDIGKTTLTTGSYNIVLQEELPLPPQNLVIMDSEVHSHWQDWSDALKDVVVFKIEEQSKTLQTCAMIISLIRQKKARHITIVGGGILADTAAFAAHLAGITFDLIPTTLLAMADACVGGKTGVNYPPYGKNQIGAFAFPTQVIVASAWLKTLPLAHCRAGLAECLKHAFITADQHLLTELSKVGAEDSYQSIFSFLSKIIQVKADIVARDPDERGERASLNLGHTLAHALEALNHRDRPNHLLIHGHAVAYGLLFAIHLSHHAGYLSQAYFEKYKKLLITCHFFTAKNAYSLFFDKIPTLEALLPYFSMDKKSASHETNRTRWVLLSDDGIVHDQGQFVHSLSQTLVETSFAAFEKTLRRLGAYEL